MLGSLTFLPAVLSFLGEKGWLEKGRVPYIAKRRHKTNGESRFWNAVLTPRSSSAPRCRFIVAGGLLVPWRSPALNMQFKAPGTTACRAAARRSSRRWTASTRPSRAAQVPATVVVKAKDVTAPEVKSAIKQLHDQAIRDRAAVRAVERPDQPGQDRRAV